MTAIKIGLLATLAATALALATPTLAADKSSQHGAQTYDRGHDDGGCHSDDHGVCRHHGEGPGHP